MLRTVGAGPPWAMAGAGLAPDALATYSDPVAAESQLAFEEGWRLMEFFLKTK